MTVLDTFTNSFQATLDHGAPSRHGAVARAPSAASVRTGDPPKWSRVQVIGFWTLGVAVGSLVCQRRHVQGGAD